MTSATEVPDQAYLKANAICSSEKVFFATQKPTHSGGAIVKKTNIPDGSRNGEDVKLTRQGFTVCVVRRVGDLSNAPG
jgi:hypothetical protein